MTLRVYTARVSYAGADRLDVTRRTAEKHRHSTGEMHPGEPFAPSRAILNPALDLMKNAAASLSFEPHGSDGAKFAVIVQRSAWALYAEAYRGEMRESYRAKRPAWEALLARPEVTLCCYCVDPTRCHRTLLAIFLAKLGASPHGERT